MKYRGKNYRSEKEKVEKVAKKLDIPYIYFAKKPCKGGLNKAKKILMNK